VLATVGTAQTIPGLPVLVGLEAPSGFDNLTNGVTDQTTHDADRATFEEVDDISPAGLGPVYNAQGCFECHQDPVSGAASQVTELRVGSVVGGVFVNPTVPINDGANTITGRTLINDRAICPQAQEHVPPGNPIRTFRISLNLLGDGFVENVPDLELLALAALNGGVAIQVPILESPGQVGVGRFGWKDQHASLLSFSADAYLNEQGVTNRLLPTEVTTVCNPDGIAEPNDVANDIDTFARFMRALKTPPVDATLAATAAAQRGSVLFDQIGCNKCHIRTLVTAPAGISPGPGRPPPPAALAGKLFHPFSDFLLHDIGTGDGISIAPVEHWGPAAALYKTGSDVTRNRMRTAPLWGLRMRDRLMHDGETLTVTEAIQRHKGEAQVPAAHFNALNAADTQAVLTFLQSL